MYQWTDAGLLLTWVRPCILSNSQCPKVLLFYNISCVQVPNFESLKILHPTNETSYTVPTLAVSLKYIKFLLCKFLLNCNLHIIVNVQTRITAHSELGIPFQNKNSDVYYMTRSGHWSANRSDHSSYPCNSSIAQISGYTTTIQFWLTENDWTGQKWSDQAWHSYTPQDNLTLSSNNDQQKHIATTKIQMCNVWAPLIWMIECIYESRNLHISHRS